MPRGGLIAFVLSAIAVVGCGAGTPPNSGTPATPTDAIPATPDPKPGSTVPVGTAPEGEMIALLRDNSADYTLDDTARLSGGEFVGDQADLLVEEAFASFPAATRQYVFLVDITGLDAETFPYNLRDFRLIDDQGFQYEPLFSGGWEPRLEFGNLAPGQHVKGWLTFEGPADPSAVELQYAPALALEPVIFRVLVPF